MPHLQVIFVPEWGWVGSYMLLIYKALGWRFSSPSGDGLVPNYILSTVVEQYFRPRVGIGWFIALLLIVLFAPVIFVPAWGWVGSAISQGSTQSSNSFRPRLGLGWFLKITSPKNEE